MPENEQGVFDGIVYSRIKQINTIPAELNKQVMGLLSINRFIADDPFNSLASSGGDFQTQVYATAGKILTQELTDLVGRYVKDVNLDFGLDVNDDYSSGKSVRQTDLKIGVSKKLFQDRLSVYVGNTFALEGQGQHDNVLSGLAGDVSMEYLLTSDGKYRVKGYRVTQHELAFQSQVIKTGLVFVVVLEFNRWKNAFKFKKGKKAA
jgi:hypothetical protein